MSLAKGSFFEQLHSLHLLPVDLAKLQKLRRPAAGLTCVP